MPTALPLMAELFVERDICAFHIGYRTQGTNDVLVAVELPVDVLEQAIASGLKLETSITPSGNVISHLAGSAGFSVLIPSSPAPIRELISQAVSPGNLRLEQAPAEHLNLLLDELEAAISDVKRALVGLDC